MNGRFQRLAALTTGLLIAVAVGVGCGGNDESDRAPREILRDTFKESRAADSGRIDLKLRVTATGGGEDGSLEADVGGAFESRGAKKLPRFDFDLTTRGSGSSGIPNITAGAVSTGDRGFVEFAGDTYELDRSTFGIFRNLLESGQAEGGQDGARSRMLDDLGLDPERWLTDLENEGTEDRDGDEVIRLSGRLDVRRFFSDVRRVPERLGNLNLPGASQLPSLDDPEELAEVVDTARFDLFTTPGDNEFRGLEAKIRLKRPDGESSGPESVSVGFDLGLTDVGEEQEIGAPADAKPLSELIGSLGGSLGGLEELLQGGLGGTGGETGGSSDSGNEDAGGGAPPALRPEDTEKYFECVGKAKDVQAVQRCAEAVE